MPKAIFLSEKVKKGLIWVATASFSALFLWFAVQNGALRLLGQLGVWPVILLISIAVLYLLESVVTTKILLRGMKFNVPFKGLYLVQTASMPANYTTPTKIGLPIRLLLYKKFFNIPYSAGTASIALESMIGIGVGTIIAFIGIFQLFGELLPNFQLLWVFGILTIVLLGLIAVTRPFALLTRHFSNSKFDRFIRFAKGFKESLKTVPIIALFWVFFLLLVRIITRVLVVYFLLWHFSSQISLLEVLYIQSISGLVGIFSMLPMGLGVQEISYVALLSKVGVPRDVSLLVAIIDRTMWTLVPFILGMISANRIGLQWVTKGSDFVSDPKNQTAS